jgi:hypothetical protein
MNLLSLNSFARYRLGSSKNYVEIRCTKLCKHRGCSTLSAIVRLENTQFLNAASLSLAMMTIGKRMTEQ